MIHELRRYRLKPGAASEYLTLFAGQGLPLVTRHLPLMGYWLGETGPLNTIYHLWSYADWTEREACRASLATEDAWTKGFIPEAFALVEEQQNWLMKTVATSSTFDEQLLRRREYHQPRERGSPLFAPPVAALVAGNSHPNAVAVWEVLSGEPPKTFSLLPRTTDPMAKIPQDGIYLVLRPLGFSPL